MGPMNAPGFEIKREKGKQKFYLEVKDGQILNLQQIKLKTAVFKE